MRTLVLAAGLSLSACVGPREAVMLPAAPFVVVLGTAQDGGLPQLACRGENCRRAREEPGFRRLVTSLLLVDPRSGQRWLFDATPDLPEQLERSEAVAPRAPAVGRPALFDGVFLTHAHVGHYSGLLQLGREAYGSEAQLVHASPRMTAFLAENGPWGLLIEAGHLRVEPMAPGEVVELAPDLRVRALAVPHRDEYSDTLAFVIDGPRRSCLYLPDVDKWAKLEPPIEALLAEVDLALVDGSFFSAGELPGRSMEEIPHPFVVESLERFAPLPASERAKLIFTHLNHSNPACDPGGPEAVQVRAAGCRVASEGLLLEL